MQRDDMILEISMRRDIPMEDVEEVLEEEDIIIAEERMCRKKKKCMFMGITIFLMLAGAAITLFVLDKKDKIDIEDTVKKYVKKYMDKKQA